jgi:hypothetical protein
MEWFDTIPNNATSPMSDGNERDCPVSVSPQNTPISERGIGMSDIRASL